jgi:ELWxxDGT repeat protein
VKDINPGVAGSTPRFFGTVGGKVCFPATTAAEGRELWCSDGTTVGTVLTKDIRAGASSSSIDESPVAMGGYLYFGANDGTNGDEVWRTDGTTANTTRVTNINPGSASTSPRYFAVMNGGVFFNGHDGTRWEMWRTDGTTTNMITGSINNTPYSNPGPLVVAGNTLFFGATHPTAGYELFKTDGTAGGVQLIKDINATAPNASSSLNYVTAVKNLVFFSARDGLSGTELWVSDGTASGTGMVIAGAGDFRSSNPFALANSNDVLYVTLDDPAVGQEPFTVSP